MISIFSGSSFTCKINQKLKREENIVWLKCCQHHLVMAVQCFEHWQKPKSIEIDQAIKIWIGD